MIRTKQKTLKMMQKPSLIQQFGCWIFNKFIAKWTQGKIQLSLPNGENYFLGNENETESLLLEIKDYRFFNEILFAGDIGFGKAYLLGYWDSPSLTSLLALFATNQLSVEDQGLGLSWLGEFLQKWTHRMRRNTIKGSRKNIHEHYDLGNDFYQQFLDSTMSYSCALYQNPSQELAGAQKNKIHSLLQKAKLQKEDHLLEIGTGWGSLAIEAANTYGCRVTTVTISEEQFKFAQNRVKEAGLVDLISVEFQDYRKISGSFDKIISVEMLEAVGHKNLPTFFRACEQLLKPNGIMVLQVISIADQKYEKYRKSCDWIQQYIFPGSLVPSLTAISVAMTESSHFVIEHLENIGLHYAKTLNEWNQRFQKNWKEIESLGFEESFRRKWEYYFCYCEAGFLTGHLGDLQLVLTRPLLNHNLSVLYSPYEQEGLS